MVRKMREKKAVQLEKAGKVRRTAGREWPPLAPPKKLQSPPTKANSPGPFSGFPMTIPVVRLAYKSE
jgi:hypothetical protein